MRILIVGYGSMGRRHARNARELGHEVYVRDVDEVKLCDALDDNYEVVHTGGSEWDAAIIATPASTHHEVAQGLRMVGYHGPLFVEKPLDITTDHADFWLSWPHPTTMVGYNWRFHPEVREWREALGFAPSLVFFCATNMDDWPGDGYSEPLLECSHNVDLLRWWQGGAPGALVDVEIRPGRAFLDFHNNRTMTTGAVEIQWLASGTERLISAMFRGQPTEHLKMVPHGPSLETSYRAELAAFLDAAEAEEPVPEAATFEDGIEVIRICEQAKAMAGEAA